MTRTKQGEMVVSNEGIRKKYRLLVFPTMLGGRERKAVRLPLQAVHSSKLIGLNTGVFPFSVS